MEVNETNFDIITQLFFHVGGLALEFYQTLKGNMLRIPTCNEVYS